MSEILIDPPKWATHYSATYDIVTYWKLRFTHYNTVNEEFLQRMYVWQYYENGEWIDDPTASSRLFRSVKEAPA